MTVRKATKARKDCEADVPDGAEPQVLENAFEVAGILDMLSRWSSAFTCPILPMLKPLSAKSARPTSV